MGQSAAPCDILSHTEHRLKSLALPVKKTGEQVRVQPRPSSVARRRRRHPVVPPEHHIVG